MGLFKLIPVNKKVISLSSASNVLLKGYSASSLFTFNLSFKFIFGSILFAKSILGLYLTAPKIVPNQRLPFLSIAALFGFTSTPKKPSCLP